MAKRRLSALLKLALACAVFAAGYWFAPDSDEGGHGQTAAVAAAADPGSGPKLYACPMMCVPPRSEPGSCPVCGMDLTEAAPSPADAKPDTSHRSLELTPAAVRLAQIQTAKVERRFVTSQIRLFGRIEYDPVEQYKVSAFAPGVIDRIYVERAGQGVRSGDPLFDIHSSELFYLEEQLIEVLKDLPHQPGFHGPAKGARIQRYMRPPTLFGRAAPAGTPEEQAKQKAAWENLEKIERKMRLLGLTDEAIDLVISRGRPTGISTVTTPITGVVLEQAAFKGTFVNTGDTVFVIANPTRMWARLEAYESDFGWLRIGQKAEFETDAYPGEKFSGEVLFLDPRFDPKTRTFAIGVLYSDPEARLKPNMLVRCRIHARMTADGVGIPGMAAREKAPLVIPETAPLITGKRAMVYVANPDKPGVYEAREVTLGPRAKGYYVVKRGLKAGELVVSNGSFKIDSAVQILAGSSMMGLEEEGPALAHHLPGHSSAMPVVGVPDHEDVSAREAELRGDEKLTTSRPAASRSYEDRMQELMKRREQKP